MSFWQAKTKIRSVDTKFSLYIRERDGWRCKYKFKCNGLEDFRENKGGLTCSHFQKRSKESVRFDPENCDSACRPCHAWVEDKAEGAKALEEWKKKQLGERAYNLLIIRANTTGRKDDKLTMLYIKQLFKELLSN